MRVDHVICCNLLLCLQEGDLTAQEKLLAGIPIRNKNKTISEKISRNIFKLIWAQWFSSTVLTLASQRLAVWLQTVPVWYMRKLQPQLFSHHVANQAHYLPVIMDWALPPACENIVIIALIVKGIVFLPEWEFIVICHFFPSLHRVPLQLLSDSAFSSVHGCIFYLILAHQIFLNFFYTCFSSLYPPNDLWMMASSASWIDSRSLRL